MGCFFHLLVQIHFLPFPLASVPQADFHGQPLSSLLLDLKLTLASELQEELVEQQKSDKDFCPSSSILAQSFGLAVCTQGYKSCQVASALDFLG
jgi:hypothetical protein